MAQEVKVILIDDVDGGPASETLNFALEGVKYEIDLSGANAERLRADFERWIAAGRRVTTRSSSSSSRAASDAAEVRAWARNRGLEVPARGRIPADVRAAYEAAK